MGEFDSLGPTGTRGPDDSGLRDTSCESKTEILYCPISNELFLFSGVYKLDTKKMEMTLYLYCSRNKVKKRKQKVISLKHIGWL